MDDLLHKYTAAEFIDWFKEEDVHDYTNPSVIEDDGETVIVESLDVDKVITNFIRSIRKYVIVKRGHILYIHNNETCEDVMQLHFTDDTYEEVHNMANNLIESLNDRGIIFIGKKHHCR